MHRRSLGLTGRIGSWPSTPHPFGQDVPRWFIPKRSKRGDRGIVSRLLGGVGEVVFYAALCLLGVSLFAALITVQIAYSTSDSTYYGIVGFCLRLTATLALIGVGATRSLTTVWQASSSIERRSALVGRVKSKEARLSEPAKSYPTVPFDDELINSPGTSLRYRLPGAGAPSLPLLGATLVCLILLGIASVTCVLAIETLRERRADWLLIGVAIASVAGAGWSTYFFLARLLRFTIIGPTSLEVSEHPLYPGQPLRVSLTQSGRLVLRRLEVFLVCWEGAVYQQGTNDRTELREVFRRRVTEEKDVRIDPSDPMCRIIEFQVPEQVMHSFRSRHNAIDWEFVVRGVAVRWARYERRFRVVILPFNPNAETESLDDPADSGQPS